MLELEDCQIDAIYKMKNGCILCGGTGSGKTRTALGYYYICMGGDLESDEYVLMDDIEIKDLYIITPAKKRDDKDWEREMAPLLLTTNDDLKIYNHKIVVDSWNNIQKYKDVKGAFFIFDEDRVTGDGVWAKTFVKISRSNDWVILSATPGDTYLDYVPVFIANGFFKNKSEFESQHCQYTWAPNVKYPVGVNYIRTAKLDRLIRSILVNIDIERHTVQHHEDIICGYDIAAYKDIYRKRWNPWTDSPIENASEFCQCLRRIVNSDQSREVALLELLESHKRVIVFYNYDYELEILRRLSEGLEGSGVVCAEWNGHKHEQIPKSNKWIYLVQYNAGAESWNCILTDTIIFWSQNYSYKTMVQAYGRIDRMNTPWTDLWYFHLKSRSQIDISIDRSLKSKKKFNESRFANW